MPDETPRSDRGPRRGPVVVGGAIALLVLCWMFSEGDLDRGCLRMERTLGSVIAAAGSIWLVVQMLDRGAARPHAVVMGIIVVLAGVLLGSLAYAAALAWAAALALGIIGAALVLQGAHAGRGRAGDARQADETREEQGGGT